MGYKIHINADDCSRMKVNIYDCESNNHLRIHCGIVCSLNPITINFLLDNMGRKLYDKDGNVLTLRINGI